MITVIIYFHQIPGMSIGRENQEIQNVSRNMATLDTARRSKLQILGLSIKSLDLMLKNMILKNETKIFFTHENRSLGIPVG